MIVCIIGGAFALVTPLLYKVLFSAIDAEELLGAVTSAKSIFFEAFLPGSNFGLIVPVLLSIIICKDFSFGTIRNKIIIGKSRVSIFLSMFISSATVLCATVLAHALLTLFISLIFFDYQAGQFTAGDFGYLMLSILFEMLVYIFIAALISFLSVFMKNVGLAIVMYIAINFIFTIIGSIVMVASLIAEEKNIILEFLHNINIFTSSLIGTGSSYEFKDIMYIVLTPIIGTSLFVFLGITVFKKKDIK